MGLTLANSPLRLVRDALWDMLEANTYFSAMVTSGNRVKYDALKFPEPFDTRPSSRTPAVRIRFAQCVPHQEADSDLTYLKAEFVIEVMTADQRDNDLLDLAFIIFASLANWVTYLKDALSWNSWAFAIDGEVNQEQQSLTNERLKQGITGWTAVWLGWVRMSFKTTDLQAFGA